MVDLVLQSKKSKTHRLFSARPPARIECQEDGKGIMHLLAGGWVDLRPWPALLVSLCFQDVARRTALGKPFQILRRRAAEYFEDLFELVEAISARKYWFASDEFH